jgi:hypothetical protein
MTHRISTLLVALLVALAQPAVRAAELPARINCLFLGDQGYHKPADRYNQLLPSFPRRGIDITYSDDVNDLNPQTLSRYDVLIVYANIGTISDSQAAALLEFVRSGHGFVPLHCASFCFRNNDEVVALIGGQFKKHSTGTFRTRIAAPKHEVMRNFRGFESWDETYEHVLHNEKNRTVLEFRDTEPYTWVRTEGKGRVFYTAWGHDERTWGNPGFKDLVERGIRWAAGRDVQAELAATWPALKPVEYVDQKVAYYPPGAGRTGDGQWNKMQKPLSPEESMTHMLTPPGFKVELFASDPQIKKPIYMAWDERGRLWIAETIDYPNDMQQPGQGRDRITICEDTDGDGKADKFTVFADKLSIPTSFTFANGGVIIDQAPVTLFLKDTDGDGVADVRKEIITGWGTKDTHAGPSNLHYGLDNWIWGMTGYSGYDGSGEGKPLKFPMGFHRFRPDGSGLEFLRQTNNNTWGLGFSEEGLVFGSTANNNPSVYMPIPGRYYGWMPNGKAGVLSGIADSSRFNAITDKVRQVDVHGGYTAAAGHELYTARTYPKRYWNKIAFVAEPTGHLVGAFELERSGSDFKSHNPFNLLASDDEWTAPIFAAVGPDGNVWVIDWYNYIVQHNPTPKGYETGAGNAYVTDLRDKRHGRIYRIVYTGPDGRPSKPLDLSKASPADLVAALKHDNMLWRTHAQRLLVERGQKDVVPALVALVNDTSVDEIGLNVGAIHALWTLHGLLALDGSDPVALAAAVGALRHPSAGVRRNAVQVLPPSAASAEAIVAAKLLDDGDAQVRLAALLALADQPPVDAAGAAIYAMLKKPVNEKDRWISEAATAAALRQSKGFLAASPEASQADEHAHHHHSAVAKDGPNLLPNPSFEDMKDGQPIGWKSHVFKGAADFALVDGGHSGSKCVQITSRDGADASWQTKVTVKPNTHYKLVAWVKTKDIHNVDHGFGAQINAHEIGRDNGGATMALKATSDWQKLEAVFNSRDKTSLTINCLFGGWGRSTGTAWWDDVSLAETQAPPGVTGSATGLPSIVALISALSKGLPTGPAAVVDEKGTVVIKLGVIPNIMRYDRDKLTVKAGSKVHLIFSNTDHMQHNFLLLKPNSVDKVGPLADAMAASPSGLSKSYIPDSPLIMASTPLVDPGSEAHIHFTAPKNPGEFPYICTFPGHWRIMQGVLVVE